MAVPTPLALRAISLSRFEVTNPVRPLQHKVRNLPSDGSRQIGRHTAALTDWRPL